MKEAQDRQAETASTDETLNDAEVEGVSGGHIDANTSIGHDIGTVVGAIADGIRDIGNTIGSWF